MRFKVFQVQATVHTTIPKMHYHYNISGCLHRPNANMAVWRLGRFAVLTKACVAVVGAIGQWHRQRDGPLHTLHGQVGLRGLDIEERLVVVLVMQVLRTRPWRPSTMSPLASTCWVGTSSPRVVGGLRARRGRIHVWGTKRRINKVAVCSLAVSKLAVKVVLASFLQQRGAQKCSAFRKSPPKYV